MNASRRATWRLSLTAEQGQLGAKDASNHGPDGILIGGKLGNNWAYLKSEAPPRMDCQAWSPIMLRRILHRLKATSEGRMPNANLQGGGGGVGEHTVGRARDILLDQGLYPD